MQLAKSLITIVLFAIAAIATNYAYSPALADSPASTLLTLVAIVTGLTGVVIGSS